MVPIQEYRMEIQDREVETPKIFTMGSHTKTMYDFSHIVVQLKVPTLHLVTLTKWDVFLTGSVGLKKQVQRQALEISG